MLTFSPQLRGTVMTLSTVNNSFHIQSFDQRTFCMPQQDKHRCNEFAQDITAVVIIVYVFIRGKTRDSAKKHANTQEASIT